MKQKQKKARLKKGLSHTHVHNGKTGKFTPKAHFLTHDILTIFDAYFFSFSYFFFLNFSLKEGLFENTLKQFCA